MRTVKQLFTELDEWIFIGIDSDLYECRAQRPEYQPLVERAEALGLYGSAISHYVLGSLRAELLLPWYKRQTQWHLFKVWLKKTLRIR